MSPTERAVIDRAIAWFESWEPCAWLRDCELAEAVFALIKERNPDSVYRGRNLPTVSKELEDA